MIFFVFLILLAVLLESLSLKTALKDIDYSVTTSSAVLEPLEPFEILSEVKNRGLMPHTFLKLSENLPTCIELPPGVHQINDTFVLHSGETAQTTKLLSTFYLLPKKRYLRKTAVHIKTRGRVFLGSATLTGGDFLGIREVSQNYYRACEVVVLPERAEDEAVLSMLGGFLGDISVRRFIMEDPVMTLGYREYTGQEPQKAISWKKSAALGRMMVKQQDYTLEPCVTVLLNVEGGSEQQKERCFSLTRSVCEALEQKGIKYGFITNAAAAGSIGGWSKLPDGLGRHHLSMILEGLGRATYDCIFSLQRLLQQASYSCEQGRGHILITPEKAPALMQLARKLGEISGGAVQVIEAGDMDAGGIDAGEVEPPPPQELKPAQ